MQSARFPVKGALWMVASLLSFVGMAVASRELAAFLSTFQTLFFRSLVGLIILLPVIYQQRARLRQALDLPLQLARNAVHFCGQYAWTLGVASLPLVKVFALEFTTPIWVSLLAFLFLKERLSLARSLAAVEVSSGCWWCSGRGWMGSSRPRLSCCWQPCATPRRSSWSSS